MSATSHSLPTVTVDEYVDRNRDDFVRACVHVCMPAELLGDTRRRNRFRIEPRLHASMRTEARRRPTIHRTPPVARDVIECNGFRRPAAVLFVSPALPHAGNDASLDT
ncbi:hypothetical protein [Burkholderia mayonis]|nr:hypothetical protein [Burkholderia mayonis]